jgi:chromosomal replication initiation ATPase DnaA
MAPHKIILEAVCRECKIKYRELVGKKKTRPLANARSIATFLLREDAKYLFREIAPYLGWKDTSTAYTAWLKGCELMNREYFQTLVSRIRVDVRERSLEKQRGAETTVRENLARRKALSDHRALTSRKFTSISLVRVVESVAEEFRVPADQILGSARREFVAARRIAMFVACIDHKQNLSAIARFFGKHHTTVLHACALALQEQQENELLRERIERIRSSCLARHL